jgi:ribose/xylose/arabinose/galactoside ABC-type transport system permease subunit
MPLTSVVDREISAPATPLVRRWPALPPQVGPVIGLVLVTLVLGIVRNRSFATAENFRVMLVQTAVVGTAALGMTLVIICGGIDLSVGSNVALTTVVIALLLKHGAPPAVAALGGVAVAMACGLAIGLLVAGLQIAPFIITLGMWGALRGAAKLLAHQKTVYPERDTWLNELLRMLRAEQRWMGVPPGVWATVALAVLVALMLRYTRFGRHVFAVGSNEQTARLCGIPVVRVKVWVYVLGAMFAGLAAVLHFSVLTVGDPTTANGMELDVIAAVVIGGASLSGGQGYVFGSLVGALFMTVIANGCTKMGWENPVQEIATGAIIGVAAIIDRVRRRRAERGG